MLKLPVLHHRQGPIVFLFQVLSSSGGRRAVCAWIISVDDGNAGGPDQAADGIWISIGVLIDCSAGFLYQADGTSAFKHIIRVFYWVISHLICNFLTTASDVLLCWFTCKHRAGEHLGRRHLRVGLWRPVHRLMASKHAAIKWRKSLLHIRRLTWSQRSPSSHNEHTLQVLSFSSDLISRIFLSSDDAVYE